MPEFGARRILSRLTSIPSVRLCGELLFWLLGLRRKREEIDISEIKRVLILRLDQIGDVVLTTPFLRELRRNLSDAWITLLVRPTVYNLVELCPYVNEVLIYDCNKHGYFRQLRRHWRALGLLRSHLWPRKFELTILPRWDADYYNATFISFFSGARWRVGYSENVIDHKRRVNGGYDRLLTHVLDNKTPKHEVERNLDVIRFLGGTVHKEGLELWVGQEDETFAECVLTLHKIRSSECLVAFGLGAREPKRMWPLYNFVEVGIWLRREYNARIVLIGAPKEIPLGEKLHRQIGDKVINVTGEATLRQIGALLKKCQLCVSNDTGTMHLAAAAGVPVIEVSPHPREGSGLHWNSPRRFRPWGVPHIVLQPERALAPCSTACNHTRAHCILGVGVDQTKRAVSTLLSR